MLIMTRHPELESRESFDKRDSSLQEGAEPALRVLAVYGSAREAALLNPVLEGFHAWPDVCAKAVCLGSAEDAPADIHLGAVSVDERGVFLSEDSLKALDELFRNESPGYVLVTGGSSSALAGASRAFRQEVPVALLHGDVSREGPRSTHQDPHFGLVSAIANLHVVRSQEERDRLHKKGIESHRIHVSTRWLCPDENESDVPN